jgi:hypothetical protein
VKFVFKKKLKRNKLGENLISLSSGNFSSGLALGDTKIETHDVTL